MRDYQVPEPILNSPFSEPTSYWRIREGEQPERVSGRRPAQYWYPNPRAEVDDPGRAIELKLVNRVRERVSAWRTAQHPGVSRVTAELLSYWRREGRKQPLFFAQLEAAETIIFLIEARRDFLQGIDVPREEVPEQTRAKGFGGFLRYACKMATGTGKTTVMGMLAAWSILNKVASRNDARFADLVLVICPNLTIRSRLQELDPAKGTSSLYITRDLVPMHLMPSLSRGRVLVRNWHELARREMNSEGGVTARVVKKGVPEERTETVLIGPKTTTARGNRYLTVDDYEMQVNAGLIEVLHEERDKTGALKKVLVRTQRVFESDAAFVRRVLGSVGARKQAVLVFNDEAHHAYRIRREEPDDGEDEASLFGDEETVEEYFKEATEWIDGLDRIHNRRGILFAVDLSATPYYLGRVGQDQGRTFEWVVSDFSLSDAIESGLVKIPQLAVRDASGAQIPAYFNIWDWIQRQLSASERGGRRASPKPEAVLRYAWQPITMLATLWEELRNKWARESNDPRPPVFIIVCKDTQLARVVHEWLALDKPPVGIPSMNLPGFRNTPEQEFTIRVDTRVVEEGDAGQAQADRDRWMRFTLDTVGKIEWPRDPAGKVQFPDGFEALAQKLDKPLHPPGRDVRCIVSVAMLTEGWDCNTVTHVIGLRPFTSQLLCEQVVGRGLRRVSYDPGPDGRLGEEIAKIFGVPLQVAPFKIPPTGREPPPRPRHHVYALGARSHLAIQFPRVQGYTRRASTRIAIDWNALPLIEIDPTRFVDETGVKAGILSESGRPSLTGPGAEEHVDLRRHRQSVRRTELKFQLAAELTRRYCEAKRDRATAQSLFPQFFAALRELERCVRAPDEEREIDVFFPPYRQTLVESILLQTDIAGGEEPEKPVYEEHRGAGSTADVDFWTVRDVRPVTKSHVNFVVADTEAWEQQAAWILDRSEHVESFVKNAGLGFAIPYIYEGAQHDYEPDFIVRLGGPRPVHLILEIKGYDKLAEVKRLAAMRWVHAVNADGRYGLWDYEMVRAVREIEAALAR